VNDITFLFLLILFIFIIVDIFLYGAISALSGVSRARLISLQEEQPQAVQKIFSLIDAPLRWFSAITSLQWARRIILLLMFLSIYIMLFWLLPESGELPLLQVFSSRSFLLWLAAMLLLSILLAWAEMITTQIIQQNPERWALRWIDYIHYLERGFSPFLVPALLLSPAKQSFTQFRHLVTEDELKSMVDASEQGGVLEQEERKMIYSIFELGDTVVREIMVPRIDIVALPSQASISDALQTLNESGFSRVPVYEETIDNILGILYAKDLLKLISLPQQTHQELSSILRKAYFVPEAKKVDELLEEMQTNHVHLAIAVDEYGGVAGLVTLEDIIEEIIGDIRDEFDEGEEIYYQQIGEDDYLCSGKMDIDDVNDLFGSNLPTDEADTLAGLIYQLLGRIPTEKETITVDDLLLTPVQVHKRRIRQVRVQRIPQGDKNDQS